MSASQGPRERRLIRFGRFRVYYASRSGGWRRIRTWNDPEPRTYGFILGRVTIWLPRSRRKT